MGFFVQVPPSVSPARDWTGQGGGRLGSWSFEVLTTEHNGADLLVSQSTSLGTAWYINLCVCHLFCQWQGVEERNRNL